MVAVVECWIVPKVFVASENTLRLLVLIAPTRARCNKMTRISVSSQYSLELVLVVSGQTTRFCGPGMWRNLVRPSFGKTFARPRAF